MMKQIPRTIFLTVLMLSVAAVAVDAQTYKISKWVLGSGGMVSEKNSEGLKMSGILGQFAIEKVSVSSPGQSWDVYQGFWVPDGSQGTDVPEYPEGSDLKNYPNPFSNQTTIEYSVPGPSLVTLSIYEVSGKLVKTMDLGIIDGTNRLSWDAKDKLGIDVGSGSYLLEMSVEPTSVSGAIFNSFTMRTVMVVVR